MTPAEWMQLVEDTDARWPGQWTPQQATAYYHDIREFAAVDVWAGWNRLNDSGREFAPNGSLLRSKAIEERQQSARRERMGRPQLAAPDAMWWSEYAQRTFGKVVSIQEAARITHKRWDGCRSPICDIHKKEER